MIPANSIMRSMARQSVNLTFTRTNIYTPPRVRVPLGEKVLHGLAIALGVTFTPAWVILHLDDYKHKK